VLKCHKIMRKRMGKRTDALELEADLPCNGEAPLGLLVN